MPVDFQAYDAAVDTLTEAEAKAKLKAIERVRAAAEAQVAAGLKDAGDGSRVVLFRSEDV